MYVCLISHSYVSLANEKEWFTFITYLSCRVHSACRGLYQKGMRENGWQVAPLSRFVGLSLILQKLQPSSLWIYNPLTGGKHTLWSSLCSDSTYPLLLYKIHLPLLCYAWTDRRSCHSAWCPPVPCCALVKENALRCCVCGNDNTREGRKRKSKFTASRIGLFYQFFYTVCLFYRSK